jgi:hypothetical protein
MVRSRLIAGVRAMALKVERDYPHRETTAKHLEWEGVGHEYTVKRGKEGVHQTGHR